MKRAIMSLALLAAGTAFAFAAQARQERTPSYEPQQRLRTALGACLHDEVMREAYCVKKCARGFRAEFGADKPRCVGLTPDAQYTPPLPNYKPPAPDPNARPVPGA